MTLDTSWDLIFQRPMFDYSTPPFAPPPAAPAADHSAWEAARDARLRDAEAKHKATAAAGGLKPTLLERVLVTAKHTLEQSGAEKAATDVVRTVAEVPAKLAEAIPQLGLPLALALAGVGLVAFAYVVRR